MSRRSLTVLVVLVLTAEGATVQTTAATPFTFSASQYAGDAGARAIVAGDFDLDGSPDFATANAGANAVDVFLNRAVAGGGFTVKRYAVGAGPFDMTTADFNYDGYPDLVVAAADADEIDVLFGGAGGNFKAPMRIPAPGNPRGVAAGYLLGGYSIVYSSYALGTVSFLTYDYETAAFVQGMTLSAGANPQGVAIGYFTPPPGYPDIAVANAGGSPITILESNSDGTYSRRELTAPAGSGAANTNVLVAGDFDKDGRMDLAAASTSQNYVALFMNSASGLHWTDKFTGSMISSPRGMAAADLNLDGRPELLVANRSTNSVTIFIASPSGSIFSTNQVVKSAAGARAVAAADFDGDGRVDLATGNEYASSGTVLWNRTPSAGGAGATAFEQRPLPDITKDSWTVGGPYVAADFNHNGIPDIVVGDGVVLDAKTPLAIDVGRDFPWISSALVGDFNEDGNTDLAQTTYYYVASGSSWRPVSTIDFLLGDGTGHFTLASSIAVKDPRGAVAADFNRDGHTDVVVFNDYGENTTEIVYLGRGDGTFTEGTSSARPYESLRTAADADGDGEFDLFAWNALTDQAVVHLGDGTGAFPTAQRSEGVGNSYNMQVGDLNGDGVLDVVVTRGTSLAVLAGRGDGSFAPAQFSDLPQYTYNYALADLSGDGNLDVLTAEGTLAIGKGDGTFAMNRRLNVSFDTAIPVDLDRDGLSDLVMGTYYYTAIALYNRTSEQPNRAPVAKIWPGEMTAGFAAQFDEEGLSLFAAKSYDPDLDPLSYTWLEHDQVVATGSTFYLQVPSGTHAFTLIVRDNAGAESRATATVTIQPYEEIVIHTGWYASASGAWVSGQEESTAADGVMTWHPNANAAKLETPLANPVNDITVGFPADPTQEYKLWIRLKAQGNSPYNDSVFIQFEGATDASGAPVYPIGTTTALAVNLEECSGCGVSGWGWRDEAWGSRGVVGTITLRFPKSQSLFHRMRIQTREDGVMIDQIVLSSSKYKTTRPGAVKNDATILPMTVPWD